MATHSAETRNGLSPLQQAILNQTMSSSGLFPNSPNATPATACSDLPHVYIAMCNLDVASKDKDTRASSSENTAQRKNESDILVELTDHVREQLLMARRALDSAGHALDRLQLDAYASGARELEEDIHKLEQLVVASSNLKAALQARTEENLTRKAKFNERTSEDKRRLAEVGLFEDVTQDTLLNMKVRELDRQIDTLREIVGRDHVHAKGAIGNKRAKVNEILAGLAHLKQGWAKESYDISMEAATGYQSDDTLDKESRP